MATATVWRKTALQMNPSKLLHLRRAQALSRDTGRAAAAAAAAAAMEKAKAVRSRSLLLVIHLTCQQRATLTIQTAQRLQ